MTKYSKFLPSNKTLAILGVEVPPDYYVEHDSDYITPLYVKSVKKIIDEIGLDIYNKKLVEAEKKATFTESSRWYEFEVLLNFYGFNKELESIKIHLANGSVNRKGYNDLLYYYHISGITNRFEKIDWSYAGNILIEPSKKEQLCINILETLDSNFSTSDLCYILYIANMIEGSLFKQIKTSEDILHNGFMYEIIVAYCFIFQNAIRETSDGGKLYPIVNNVINQLDVKVLEDIFTYYNNRKLELSHFTSENSKHEQEIQRLESLFKSTIPQDSWIEYLDMPSHWVQSITSDR